MQMERHALPPVNTNSLSITDRWGASGRITALPRNVTGRPMEQIKIIYISVTLFRAQKSNESGGVNHITAVLNETTLNFHL